MDTTRVSKVLRRLAEKYLPTRSIYVRDSREDPDSSAALLDVDTLHAILAEAEAGDTRRLFATYRDLVLGHSHAQSELNTRKLAVVGEMPVFTAKVKDDPESARAKDLVETAWDRVTGSRDCITHLLDACLWPVSVVEKTYRPGRDMRFEIKALKPVPYHLLDYQLGRLRIRDVDGQGRAMETFHEPDLYRYIVHRGHLMTGIPDNFGGPMRAALFWWLFSVMDRDWWIRFLERFGSPFLVGKYDAADSDGKRLLTQAFSAATRLFGLVVSRETDIDLVSTQAGASGSANAFEIFHGVAAKELSKLILGQTMTSEAQAQGLGGAQAEVHNLVRGDIRQFDALALGDTLRHQLFRQLLDINGIAAAPPLVRWGSDRTDAKTVAETIETLYRARLQPTGDSLADLSQVVGYALERVPQPIAGGDPLASLAAFAAGGPVASQPNDRLAKLAAQRWSSQFRELLSARLDSASSPAEFLASLTLPDDADLLLAMQSTAAANALLL